MSHAPIPAKLRYAAEQAGVLMARGAATWGQTQLLCRELAKEAPNLDQIGTGIRLCWIAQDAGRNHADAIWQAQDRVRRAVRPMMEAGDTKSAIEEAAGSAAEGVIDWPAIYAVLRDEAAQVRHKSRWRR